MYNRTEAIRKTLRSGFHKGTSVQANGMSLIEDIRGETGRVKITGTIDRSNVIDIEFAKKYNNPVVVAYITTRGGGQSIEVRVRNVTEAGCQIFLEEPDDENHNPETVIYMVLEEGSHITNNGYRIEAGLTTTEVHRRGGARNFEGEYVKFDKIFTTTPVILHTLNTYNNGMFASTMAQNVSTEGFEVAQELAETKKQTEEETIGWIAFETMAGKGFITNTMGEVALITATKNTGVDNKIGVRADFAVTYTSEPDIVFKGQSMNGSDGYWARGAGAWSKTAAVAYAEEDQVSNKERSHTKETFGFAAFLPNTKFMTKISEGFRYSDNFDLTGIDIKNPLVFTWETNNYSNILVEVKVSEDYGVSWSEWLPCEYAKAVPGVIVNGSLDGVILRTKITILNDVEKPVKLSEISLKSGDDLIVIEGSNVGGLAQDGTDWTDQTILK